MRHLLAAAELSVSGFPYCAQSAIQACSQGYAVASSLLSSNWPGFPNSSTIVSKALGTSGVVSAALEKAGMPAYAAGDFSLVMHDNGELAAYYVPGNTKVWSSLASFGTGLPAAVTKVGQLHWAEAVEGTGRSRPARNMGKILK